MGEGNAAPGGEGGSGAKGNEAKAHCSTKLEVSAVSIPVGISWKTSKDVPALVGTYISKATAAFEVEVKGEISVKAIVVGEAEKESEATLWVALCAKVVEQLHQTFNPKEWTYLTDWKLSGPSVGGGAEHAEGETGASFAVKVAGAEVGIGPVKVALDFTIISFSDKKWQPPSASGAVKKSLETQDIHPFAKWVCVGGEVEVSVGLELVPNFSTLWDAVKAGARQLWKDLGEAGDAFAAEVGVDGVITGAFIAGAVLVLVCSYEEIQDDDMVRGVTDNIEKGIEQAQTEYLQGLTTQFGSGLSNSSQYFTQGGKVRMKLLSNWDLWMQQKQDAAGIPSQMQIQAMIYESDNPVGGRESPEGTAWVTNFINTNAKGFKGQALADTATAVIKQIWQNFVKENPHELGIANYKPCEEVFTILAKPTEWTTYFPNLDFPAPFGTKTYVDNFAYTQCYPNDSNAHSG